jgi:hypothetical protein
MFGKKILTKREQTHLIEMGINTKYKFEKQVQFLKDEIKKEPDRILCYDCIRIAKKLEMW